MSVKGKVLANQTSSYFYSRIIAVEVLVNIKDQTGNGSIGVCDLAESVGGTVGDKGLGRRVIVPGQENQLRRGTVISVIRGLSNKLGDGSKKGEAPTLHCG